MKPVYLIMGTGRSGTSFLLRLLVRLGLDAGGYGEFFRHAKGPLKRGEVEVPELIKGTGGLCINLHKHMDDNNLTVKHAWVAVRPFKPCLASQMKKKRGKGAYKRLSEEEFKAKISRELPFTIGSAIQNLVERQYPFTVIEFPRMIDDKHYCFRKVEEGLAVPSGTFLPVWEGLVNPEKVHHR